jgi:uncharacterized protein with GYD domain
MEIQMPTYIILINWTQQGLSSIKESPTRLDGFKHGLDQVGGTLRGFYMVAGEYDMIAIVEVPNDEAVAKLMLIAGAKGSIRTTTLRAFTEDEYRKIIAELP